MAVDEVDLLSNFDVGSLAYSVDWTNVDKDVRDEVAQDRAFDTSVDLRKLRLVCLLGLTLHMCGC